MGPNETLEQECAAVAKTPMRVTLQQIEDRIAKATYIEADGNTLTICVLTLENGFTVTGESACADPANYNQDLGRKIAKDNATKKIWPLEGYLLRQRMYESAAE